MFNWQTRVRRAERVAIGGESLIISAGRSLKDVQNRLAWAWLACGFCIFQRFGAENPLWRNGYASIGQQRGKSRGASCVSALKFGGLFAFSLRGLRVASVLPTGHTTAELHIPGSGQNSETP